jgi:hypothetical protein
MFVLVVILNSQNDVTRRMNHRRIEASGKLFMPAFQNGCKYVRRYVGTYVYTLAGQIAVWTPNLISSCLLAGQIAVCWTHHLLYWYRSRYDNGCSGPAQNTSQVSRRVRSIHIRQYNYTYCMYVLNVIMWQMTRTFTSL